MPPLDASASLPRAEAQSRPAQQVSASNSGPAGAKQQEETVDTIWQDGAFRRDNWSKAADSEALPDVPTIVSRKRWLAERAMLAGRNAPLGLRLEPGEPLDDITDDLSRFALIALSFPKFSDGRAYSTATLLRGKYAFTGELRAVGNVLSDQIAFMRRVGFDSFEVTHEPTRRALLGHRIPEVTLYYQPATAHEPPAGTRPWLRRTPG